MKKLLLVCMCLIALSLKAQSTPEQIQETKEYLKNLVEAFSEANLAYSFNDEIISLAVPRNAVDSLLKLAPVYRQNFENAWLKLKSNDAVTLERILAGKDKEQVRQDLIRWKYDRNDISNTNMLAYFDSIIFTAKCLISGTFGDDGDTYLPEYYDNDIPAIKNMLDEFRYLVDYAFALHRQRLDEMK